MSCKQHKKRTIIEFFIGVCVTNPTGEGEISSETVNRWESVSVQSKSAAGRRLYAEPERVDLALSLARLMDRLHTPSAPESGESLLQFSSPGGSKRKTLVVAQPDDEEYAQDAVSVHHTESIHMHDHLLRSPNFQRRARCGQMCCCWSRSESRWASTVSLIACFGGQSSFL